MVSEDQWMQHQQNQEQLIRISRDMEHLIAEVDELKEELFGNGQPGRIALLDKRISELEKMIYRILGAVGFGLVLMNLLMAFWGKK